MNLEKNVSSVLCFCILVSMQGCLTNRMIFPNNLEYHPEYKISKVVTLTYDVYEFRNRGELRDNNIVGVTMYGDSVEVPVEQIRVLYVREVSAEKTCLYSLSGIFVGLLVYGILIVPAVQY